MQGENKVLTGSALGKRDGATAGETDYANREERL